MSGFSIALLILTCIGLSYELGRYAEWRAWTAMINGPNFAAVVIKEEIKKAELPGNEVSIAELEDALKHDIFLMAPNGPVSDRRAEVIENAARAYQEMLKTSLARI